MGFTACVKNAVSVNAAPLLIHPLHLCHLAHPLNPKNLMRLTSLVDFKVTVMTTAVWKVLAVKATWTLANTAMMIVVALPAYLLFDLQFNVFFALLIAFNCSHAVVDVAIQIIFLFVYCNYVYYIYSDLISILSFSFYHNTTLRHPPFKSKTSPIYSSIVRLPRIKGLQQQQRDARDKVKMRLRIFCHGFMLLTTLEMTRSDNGHLNENVQCCSHSSPALCL